MMGLFLPVLTPQVVLVAPIIIALGVAYGLYIANRYSEEEGVALLDEFERYEKSAGVNVWEGGPKLLGEISARM